MVLEDFKRRKGVTRKEEGAPDLLPPVSASPWVHPPIVGPACCASPTLPSMYCVPVSASLWVHPNSCTTQLYTAPRLCILHCVAFLSPPPVSVSLLVHPEHHAASHQKCSIVQRHYYATSCSTLYMQCILYYALYEDMLRTVQRYATHCIKIYSTV